MKYLVLIALGFLSPIAKAQLDTIPKVEGYYQLSEIVTVDSSLSKDVLYNNSKLYFVNSYNNAKDVIQYEDKDAGRVVGKGFFEINDSQWILPWVWDVYIQPKFW